MHLNLDDVTRVGLFLASTLTPPRLGLRSLGLTVRTLSGGVSGPVVLGSALPLAAARLLRLVADSLATGRRCRLGERQRRRYGVRGGYGVRRGDSALQAGLAAYRNVHDGPAVGESHPRNLLDNHLRSSLLAGRRRVAVRAVTSSFANLRRFVRLALCHILT